MQYTARQTAIDRPCRGRRSARVRDHAGWTVMQVVGDAAAEQISSYACLNQPISAEENDSSGESN